MTTEKMLTVTKDLQNRELTLERVVRGSRELAWEGWTKAEHIALWWGPKFWTTTVYEMDVRLGGVWHYCMRPDNREGDEVWGRAVYRDVVKPSRLTYTEAHSNAEGEVVDTSQRTVTVEFMELKVAMTKLIIRTRFTTIAELDAATGLGMVEGFAEAFDRLEALFLN
jgi:uncharacterized protein YndB with AHSA1/START domain